ncbi:uncharacterized protein Z519_12522 [Cladophialophora bantiana CBS 173.52]|uniref:Uncharacterized protein n=1 Tax=Cladophialophora bantiana (strain ATCC 10958 / CBS 173.52 / CDC B-1940 / NIH 8579) TaxID=1442370 RepID=A0A0D2H7R5_CLAB1|nr:uncharacterized protein Z519_12522 [Cladophialophora bantiana CBS 173.52]KIW86900.1 hypothetical protein Z519_12522 [Cladophialophora bantiana CBS 173.52]
MSKPFEDPTMLAFDLFDRSCMLRPKDGHKDHVTRKGLCTWETRLGYGDVLLIQDVIVEKLYRRLGLGKKTIRGLLEAAKRKTEYGALAAILWPESSKGGPFEDLLRSGAEALCIIQPLRRYSMFTWKESD